MKSIQYAKLLLHCGGVVISERARAKMPQICNGDRITTNGIQTKFWADGIDEPPQWVTVSERAESKNLLDYNERFVFIVGNNKYKCHIYPNKEFRNVGWQHTDRIRISPVKGCNCVCSYCNEYSRKYELRDSGIILRAIDDALKWQNPPRHCLISGGTPKKEDYDAFDHLLIEVSHKSPIPVEIMIGARDDPGFLRALRKSGNFSGIKMNLEFFDNDNSSVWNKLIPSKHQLGLKKRLQNIELARDLWADDIEMSSLVIVGLHIVPGQCVKNGIDWLAKAGISPVLSPFIPGINTPLAKMQSPTVEYLKEIYEYAKDIAHKYDVRLGPKCGPCQHNTLTFS